MQMRYTILYVEHVGRSLAFFEQAFGLERRMLHDSGDYGELATGDTRLALAAVALMQQLGKQPGKPDSDAPVFELAFETDDVTAALERAVAAGATLRQPVRSEPWGQTTAYVSTPDGHLIELCSPVASAG